MPEAGNVGNESSITVHEASNRQVALDQRVGVSREAQEVRDKKQKQKAEGWAESGQSGFQNRG